MAASRLQRWALVLAGYSYSIEFKPTNKHGNADSLSRLPMGPDEKCERYHTYDAIVHAARMGHLLTRLGTDTIQKQTNRTDMSSRMHHVGSQSSDLPNLEARYCKNSTQHIRAWSELKH